MSEIVQGWVRWAAWARFAPELLEIEDVVAEAEAEYAPAVVAIARARAAVEAAGNPPHLAAQVAADEATATRIRGRTRDRRLRAESQRRALAGLVIVDC